MQLEFALRAYNIHYIRITQEYTILSQDKQLVNRRNKLMRFILQPVTVATDNIQ